MMNNITVAIVTRNRSKDLAECLQSLSHQSLLPVRIMIINNNSTDDTSNVIKKFQHKIPIREYIEKQQGYPFVYNRAIEECHTEWLAFIDDDCVADKHWFEKISQMVTQNHKNIPAAILGKSDNYYDKNVFACAFQYGNLLWKTESIQPDNRIINYKVLDSRNIIYNKKMLDDSHIRFNPLLILGSEDSELGFQIYSHHLTAMYDPTIIIRHKEPHSAYNYFSKKRAYRKSVDYYNLHFPKPNEFSKTATLHQKFSIFLEVTAKLPLYQKCIVTLLVMVGKIIG